MTEVPQNDGLAFGTGMPDAKYNDFKSLAPPVLNGPHRNLQKASGVAVPSPTSEGKLANSWE